MPTVILASHRVANFPEGGGHLWVYLQYARALRLLGCDVYWLEDFCRSADDAHDARLLEIFRQRMERLGFGGKCIVSVSLARRKTSESSAPAEYFQMTRAEAEAIFARADLLLNFHYAMASAMVACFRRTALVDIDPGLLQFWISRGQLSVAPHDFHFTTGETVGVNGTPIPDCNREWIHIRPPVCLESWPCAFDPAAEAFTTVSNWDGNDWVVDEGETYENTKRVSFLEFADLPKYTRQPLELALFLRTDRDEQERQDLERRGWRIRYSRDVASTPESYRSYVQRSRGEFSCSKRSCRKLQNAWVSDRTLCYLASGKPAVVQHTGPSSFLPNGEGLFRFTTLEEAAAALETVNAHYKHHSRAARQIAETYFDGKQVATTLLNHTLN